MMKGEMGKGYLDFMVGKRNIYYAGLDDLSLPSIRSRKNNHLSLEEHIRYMVALSLLVDHIAIPPGFIASSLAFPGAGDIATIRLGDLFQEKAVMTAVYGNMAKTTDFLDQKMEKGIKEERELFRKLESEARPFFKSIPLLRREAMRGSEIFKIQLIENLHALPKSILSPRVYKRIIEEVSVVARRGEVVLDRETFMKILEEMRLSPKSYRACLMAMNSAYYYSGATTYHADISLPNVELYSAMGRRMFEGGDNRIQIAYDPRFFLDVLEAYGIKNEEIDRLTYQDIQWLRKTEEFKEFKNSYHRLCKLIQDESLRAKKLSGPELLQLKYRLLKTITKEYNVGSSRVNKYLRGEKFTVGLFLACLRYAISYTSLIGNIIFAAGIFYSPITHRFRCSPVQLVARKLGRRQFAFYLYLDMLDRIFAGNRK